MREVLYVWIYFLIWIYILLIEFGVMVLLFNLRFGFINIRLIWKIDKNVKWNFNFYVLNYEKKYIMFYV